MVAARPAALNRKQRKALARRLRVEDPGLDVMHPHAAGIDVGNSAHYVAVRPDRDPDSCARDQHVHPADAEGADADEHPTGECRQRSEWLDRAAHRPRDACLLMLEPDLEKTSGRGRPSDLEARPVREGLPRKALRGARRPPAGGDGRPHPGETGPPG